jgi:hypothetical protein
VALAAGRGWALAGALAVWATFPVAGAEPPPTDPGLSPPGASLAAPRGDEGAVVKYNGTPVAGSRITLGVEGTVAPGTSCRWVQVEGPPVSLGDATKPVVALTVPAGAEKLGFLLVLSNKGETRTIRVNVPIKAAVADPSAPMAEAGDDQVGLVGHRVTLRGECLTLADKVAYRWVQVSGPKMEKPSQDRSYFSFTPAAAGVYKFGLTVATVVNGSTPAISEMDEVQVTVGEPPTSPGWGPSGVFSAAYPSPALDQALRAASGLATRPAMEQMAATFEAIAERSSLYSTFADLSAEMMRRLDAIAPADPAGRQLWSQAIFGPLSQHTAAELRAVGVELGHPQGLYQELNPAQKDKLRVLYGLYAREFRSRTQSR